MTTALPASPHPAPSPPLRVRTWPALLALLFLSPVIGEMLSGSTPPLRFIQPFSIIALPTLYGVSAVLIREIIARRGLGWLNALLMGAAFGVFQEALVVQTWFNFMAPGSPSHSEGAYGALWATNWHWALNLTIYHAIISITAPLTLIALFFPRQRPLPWLRTRGAIALAAWLFLLCGALTVNAGFKQFASEGYAHPPLVPYLAAVALTVALFLAGALVRFPAPTPDARPAPRLWSVRLQAFAYITVFFLVVSIVLPSIGTPAPVAMAVSACTLATGVWRARAWSARAAWGARHRLAVVTGVLMYFAFAWGPLIEFLSGQPQETGLIAANFVAFALLLAFDAHLKRRGAASQPETATSQLAQ